eukprot:11515011-Alexandrium_andersonii.AAC.1
MQRHGSAPLRLGGSAVLFLCWVNAVRCCRSCILSGCRSGLRSVPVTAPRPWVSLCDTFPRFSFGVDLAQRRRAKAWA